MRFVALGKHLEAHFSWNHSILQWNRDDSVILSWHISRSDLGKVTQVMKMKPEVIPLYMYYGQCMWCEKGEAQGHWCSVSLFARLRTKLGLCFNGTYHMTMVTMLWLCLILTFENQNYLGWTRFKVYVPVTYLPLTKFQCTLVTDQFMVKCTK